MKVVQKDRRVLKGRVTKGLKTEVRTLFGAIVFELLSTKQTELTMFLSPGKEETVTVDIGAKNVIDMVTDIYLKLEDKTVVYLLNSKRICYVEIIVRNNDLVSINQGIISQADFERRNVPDVIPLDDSEVMMDDPSTQPLTPQRPPTRQKLPEIAKFTAKKRNTLETRFGYVILSAEDQVVTLEARFNDKFEGTYGRSLIAINLRDTGEGYEAFAAKDVIYITNGESSASITVITDNESVAASIKDRPKADENHLLYPEEQFKFQPDIFAECPCRDVAYKDIVEMNIPRTEPMSPPMTLESYPVFVSSADNTIQRLENKVIELMEMIQSIKDQLG